MENLEASLLAPGVGAGLLGLLVPHRPRSGAARSGVGSGVLARVHEVKGSCSVA